MKNSRNRSGFTLIEIAIVIMIIVIIAAVAVPAMKSVDEDAEAQLIKGIASSIDTAVSDGLNRGFTLGELKTSRLTQLQSAVQSSAPAGVTISLTGSDFIITINASQRWGRVTINNNGEAQFTSIDTTRFPHYNVVNGEIEKI